MVFWKILHKCCMIGTKTFKIGGEMAKKNKLEVGNPPCPSKNESTIWCSEFWGRMPTSSFLLQFESFGAYHAAFVLNFPKHHNFSISDQFKRSYGHFNKDHNFLKLCIVDKLNSTLMLINNLSPNFFYRFISSSGLVVIHSRVPR